MLSIDVPTLGPLVLAAALVSAAYTMAMAIAAAGGRPHLLPSVRFGALATAGLIAIAVLLLAYAFQEHDFRIRYVARYSDRSMSPFYLFTALWGGQDGSLLWWSFNLGAFIAAFTWWIKDRCRALQPVAFVTLMGVLSFFLVLQIVSANPFATSHGAPPIDGDGLNPLLQNYWMAVHPPALYLGLTGWTIPFALVVAALVTGRLHEEWIQAARTWVLAAFAFLTLGNMLGMFWSYEELGWGGYWAWDPVENASFLPWLTGTAYLHSVMIQERRGTLKVWNVFLLSSTFILTVFGTFLTRSGLIASVHSFARSDMGIYFAWFLVGLVLFAFVLIGWRLAELRGGRRVGAVAALVAIAVGVLIDLVLLVSGAELAAWQYGLLATVPLGVVGGLALVEATRAGEIGRAWAVPLLALAISGLAALLVGDPTEAALSLGSVGVAPWQYALFALGLPAGVGLVRLAARRRAPHPATSSGIESLLSREFAFLFNNWILLAMTIFVLVATTFPLISEWLRGVTVTVGPGYYNQWMVPMGLVLLLLTGVGPLISWRKATGSNLVRAFRWPVITAVVVGVAHLVLGERVGLPPFVEWQEIYDTSTGRVLAAIYSVAPIASSVLSVFVLAAVVQEFARGTAVRRRTTKESVPVALFTLVAKARRRYGGYIVHVGIVLMFIGFTGSAYDEEREASLRPGQSMEVGGYTLRYEGVRVEQDTNKHMTFADVTIFDGDREVGRVAPAKYVYRTHPQMPTTEVAIRSTLTHDLYVILSTVDPRTGRATFRALKQPLVLWIWIGGVLLLFGVFVAIFPRLAEIRAPSAASMPRAGAIAGALLVALLAGSAIPARAQDEGGSSSLHAGTVEILDPVERRLFDGLLCMCGDCQRLPLSSCGCGWAEGMRTELRGRLARGDETTTIMADYRERFSAQAIAIPADQGLERALWAVPVMGIGLAAFGIVLFARRSARAGRRETDATLTRVEDEDATSAYEARLEDELRDLEED